MEVSGQPCGGHLTPCESLQHPLNRRLSGPQSHFRDFGEEQNLLAMVGFEPASSSL